MSCKKKKKELESSSESIRLAEPDIVDTTHWISLTGTLNAFINGIIGLLQRLNMTGHNLPLQIWTTQTKTPTVQRSESFQLHFSIIFGGTPTSSADRPHKPKYGHDQIIYTVMAGMHKVSFMSVINVQGY